MLKNMKKEIINIKDFIFEITNSENKNYQVSKKFDSIEFAATIQENGKWYAISKNDFFGLNSFSLNERHIINSFHVIRGIRGNFSIQKTFLISESIIGLQDILKNTKYLNPFEKQILKMDSKLSIKEAFNL